MKTLRLIGMALMAVLLNMSFSACSDDDDDENSGIGNKESLYGTWQVTHVEGWEKVNGRMWNNGRLTRPRRIMTNSTMPASNLLQAVRVTRTIGTAGRTWQSVTP